jgi:hypothetical protein
LGREITGMMIMPEIVQEISCPDCGAPLKVKPGDAIVTCEYCSSDVNLAVGTKYFLKHSIVPPKFDERAIDELVRGWMGRGFLKPGDLARKYRVLSKELQILPLFIVHASVKSEYQGQFTRTGQPIDRSGVLEKQYYWKVLGRRASAFPTREYAVPLSGKVDFNMSKLVPGARFLNSEIDEREANDTAIQQLKEHQKFLLQNDLDIIQKLDTDIEIIDTEFLHVSVWFITYQYRGKTYELILDACTGEDIKAEIPQIEKRGLRGLFGG